MARDIYFEDMPVGFYREGGQYLVTEAEVIEFGRRFDPLPVHIDPEAAAASPFGRLIAAGCHILSIGTKLTSELNQDDRFHYICGMGFDEVRFLKPAYVGDVLSVRVEVVSARRSASRPNCGIVIMQQTIKNQCGEMVATLQGAAWTACRSASKPDQQADA